MRFAGGYLMVDDVRIVDESKLTKADARRAGFESLDMLRAELAKGGDGETYRIALHWDGEDERIALRSDDALSEDELAAIEAKLARLDKASTRGPWTQITLTLISEHPACAHPTSRHRSASRRSCSSATSASSRRSASPRASRSGTASLPAGRFSW